MLVVTTPEADAQIRAADAWWRQNRPAAPLLFQQELSEIFSTLATSPRIGAPYGNQKVPGARRLLMRATRFHAYYVEDGQRVILLAIWSAVRRQGPRL